MKAMILAAGRGERMRPLTNNCPKPLLSLGKEALIERHLRRLASAGFKDIVINTAYLGTQIEAALGDGSFWNVSISYSHEDNGGLETAGGIATALPLLGRDIFFVINADIFTDFSLQVALERACTMNTMAHLWLVDNPPHHPKGDFGINDKGRLSTCAPLRTFSGISLYHPDFFKHIEPNQRVALAPILRAHSQMVSAEYFQGQWLDVGTPERLEVARRLSAQEQIP